MRRIAPERVCTVFKGVSKKRVFKMIAPMG
jgi:hypothetical protein